MVSLVYSTLLKETSTFYAWGMESTVKSTIAIAILPAADVAASLK
jgi:hypothetical protein